jgi:hypothetical protein
MPIFLDRHDMKGTNAAEVAEAGATVGMDPVERRLTLTVLHIVRPIQADRRAR